MHTNSALKPNSAWPKKSAGYIMTDKVPVIPSSYTLEQCHDYLLKNIRLFDSINYIYSINTDKKLIGVFSIKELYRAPKHTPISQIQTTNLVAVLPTYHQREVAEISLKHNIKAVPVVDDAGVFLGSVPSDIILTILNKEFKEDILRLSGIHSASAEFDNILEVPFWQAVSHRIPWLLIGTFSGILTAKLIGLFENTLEQNLTLATFIPLIVYVCGAISAQLETFVVRDVTIFRKLNVIKYVWKQFLIICTTSIVLSICVGLISFALYSNINIALILGLTIIIASLATIITGLLIPLFFRKLHFDPANTSGPIGTIVQDIISIFVYLIIASWLL